MSPGSLIAVGSYTHSTAVGIRLFELADDGGLEPRGSLGGIEHPSFLARHPHLDVLYAVSEADRFDDADGGGVVAIALDRAAGGLEPFDRVSSHGVAPCHLSVGADGRHLYVANYVSGSIAAHTLRPDGGFGDLLAAHAHSGSGPTDRQQGPHAHCIVPSPGGDVHAVDLGIDRIVQYRHDESSGTPSLDVVGGCDLAPGCGPRHLAFHPTEPVAFVVGELDSSVTVLWISGDHGMLEPGMTGSTLPDGRRGESLAAEIAIDPDGRFVYVSNRGHDTIAIFEYDPAGRGLRSQGHVESLGCNPRHFAIDPNGSTMIVANQDSNNLVRFEIDRATGRPDPMGITTAVPEPVCVVFLEEVT